MNIIFITYITYGMNYLSSQFPRLWMRLLALQQFLQIIILTSYIATLQYHLLLSVTNL